MTEMTDQTRNAHPVLRVRSLGSLIEQLGAQMYPGATESIAELISNAWDADAANVWVDIPLGQPWTKDDQIVVTDDGAGMSSDEAQTRYLMVGRKRRVELGKDRTDGGRLLHGRKGIGKLAAFGIARVLECLTVDAHGRRTSFRLDYDRIRCLEPMEDYEVEQAQAAEALRGPDSRSLTKGTRITLSTLRPRKAMNEEQFRRSLARRFALDASEMSIFVNGEEVDRFSYDLEIRFPRDGQLFDTGVSVTGDGWAEMQMDDGRPVRWWVGFTEKPLREKRMQGVSVLARGKMVNRPFFFQRTAGAEGQLGQEYLLGEVQADWIDDGYDIDTDLIQANRDQLQLDYAQLDPFVEWGDELIRLALRKWSSLRRRRVSDGVDISGFKDLLGRLTTEERKRMQRVVHSVAKIPAIDINEARDLIRSIVDAHEDTIVRELLESIDSSAPDFQTQIWQVVQRFGLIDARRNQTIIQARLKTISELRRFVDTSTLRLPTRASQKPTHYSQEQVHPSGWWG